jgi:hypothetical protein
VLDDEAEYRKEELIVIAERLPVKKIYYNQIVSRYFVIL